MTREDALLAARAFIVPEDMGTPPGALALRGATNFQTPAGLGHRLHADLQHDRSAGGADARRPRRDRLVRARNRIPLRAASPARGFPGRTACRSARSCSSRAKRSRFAIARNPKSRRSSSRRRNSRATRPPPASPRRTECPTARTTCGRAARRNRRPDLAGTRERRCRDSPVRVQRWRDRPGIVSGPASSTFFQIRRPTASASARMRSSSTVRTLRLRMMNWPSTMLDSMSDG